MPCSQKGVRQRCTTWGLVPSRDAVSVFVEPSAAISTHLARWTSQTDGVTARPALQLGTPIGGQLGAQRDTGHVPHCMGGRRDTSADLPPLATPDSSGTSNVTGADEHLNAITINGNLTVPSGDYCDLVEVVVTDNVSLVRVTGGDAGIANSAIDGSLQAGGRYGRRCRPASWGPMSCATPRSTVTFDPEQYAIEPLEHGLGPTPDCSGRRGTQLSRSADSGARHDRSAPVREPDVEAVTTGEGRVAGMPSRRGAAHIPAGRLPSWPC